MTGVVADTHAAIWHLVDPKRLSVPARQAFLDAATDGQPVYLSPISLVEAIYLIDKGKVQGDVFDRLVQAITDPSIALVLAPLDQQTTLAVRLIPRAQVPDMPDRIIAATALALNLPLVTRDRKIQASGVTSIW